MGDMSLSAKPPVPMRSTRLAQPDLSQLLRDFYRSAKNKGSWFYASWIEILLAYRSTFVGPLWIVIGTGAFVFIVGSLYSRVVLTGGTNVYLAHLAVGLVLWQFFIQTISGSCGLFRKNKANILDGENSYTLLLLKMVMTNAIYLLHNAIIVVLAFLYLRLAPTPAALIVFLTFPLVIANLLWISVIFSILGTRYADFEQFVHATLRLMFFMTPILWIPHEHIRGAAIDLLLYFNPFYYMLEVIRGPLVYGTVPYFEIAVVTLTIPIGWLIASFLYLRTKASIALWL